VEGAPRATREAVRAEAAARLERRGRDQGQSVRQIGPRPLTPPPPPALSPPGGERGRVSPLPSGERPLLVSDTAVGPSPHRGRGLGWGGCFFQTPMLTFDHKRTLGASPTWPSST